MLLLVAGTAASVLGPAPAAQAHPFGPPLTAHLVPDDRRPTLVWHGAEDDWTALGDALGVFADPDPERTGAQLLTDAPEVRGYLEETVRLRQGDADCRSIADSGTDVVQDGMTITFDCPLPPEDGLVELTVESMIDLHSAYRTVLTVEGSETKVMFTGEEPTQDVDTSGAGGTVAAVALGGGAVAAVLVGSGWFVLRRRRT